MTWVSVILALLKVAGSLLQIAQQRQWIKAGEDAEIARTSAAILQSTATAKAIMVEVTGLSDTQVDEALKRLEP